MPTNHFLWMVTLLTPMAYFYFNWRYFALVTAALKLPHMRRPLVVAAFLINFPLFYLCSLLELNLIFNWSAFFVFLMAETCWYCRGRGKEPLYFTLIGIICGLTINIFCRCVIAIIVAEPLANFDNHVVTQAGNMKGIAVCLGFLLGGVVFRFLAGPVPVRWARTLLEHPKHMTLLLKVMAGMFAYLCLNLLICHAQDNTLLLKLWGIKSCVFSVVGTALGMRYSLQLCSLSDYREQNRTIQKELAQKALEEKRLWNVAYHDALTGCFSRQYALESIACLLEGQVPFALCFADLNGLKAVNDRWGHAAGDQYLTTVARELQRACRRGRDLLARYGGDEFVIVFQGATLQVAESRLAAVSKELREQSLEQGLPYLMSLSYGVVEGTGGSADELIHRADKRQYEMKKHAAAAPDPGKK